MNFSSFWWTPGKISEKISHTSHNLFKVSGSYFQQMRWTSWILFPRILVKIISAKHFGEVLKVGFGVLFDAWRALRRDFASLARRFSQSCKTRANICRMLETYLYTWADLWTCSKKDASLVSSFWYRRERAVCNWSFVDFSEFDALVIRM